MTKNVGGLDRFFRLGIGFLSLAIAFASQDLLLRVVFAGTAVIGLGTALIGYCPLNKALGLDTTEPKKK